VQNRSASQKLKKNKLANKVHKSPRLNSIRSLKNSYRCNSRKSSTENLQKKFNYCNKNLNQHFQDAKSQLKYPFHNQNYNFSKKNNEQIIKKVEKDNDFIPREEIETEITDVSPFKEPFNIRETKNLKILASKGGIKNYNFNRPNNQFKYPKNNETQIEDNNSQKNREMEINNDNYFCANNSNKVKAYGENILRKNRKSGNYEGANFQKMIGQNKNLIFESVEKLDDSNFE